MLLAGIIAGAMQGSSGLPGSASPGSVLAGLSRFDPAAISVLGLLLMFMTPVLSVTAVAVFSLVRRDRLGAIASLGVIVALAVSVVLAFQR